MTCVGGYLKIFIGFDPREAEAFAVAAHSLKAHLPAKLLASGYITIHGLLLKDLQQRGLYTRPTSPRNDGIPGLMDGISGHPMATEFALSRFFVPHLSEYHGVSLFTDVDVLARTSVMPILERAARNHRRAVWCVHHDYTPANATKMEGQQQLAYGRKNWSSVMVFNNAHPACKGLTPAVLNAERGLWLHQFQWCPNGALGELGPEWNYLVGVSPPLPGAGPALVHFTDGGPWLPEFSGVEFADEWRAARERWIAQPC